jgi:long-chain acyl-CoA synthetase
MDLMQLIDRQAQVRPEAIALIRGASVVTFWQLAGAIRNLATHLAAQGIAPGDRVGIAMGQTPFHVIVILALARIGAVSLPVHARHPAGTRKAIVDHFTPVTIVAGREKDRVEGCSLLLADPSWLRKPAEAKLPPTDEDMGDRAWRINLSSGTTGLPRGVLRTHNDLVTQILFEASVVRFDAATRFLCAMDINLGASLRRVLRHLTAGGAVIFTESTSWDAVEGVLASNQPTHSFVSPGFLSGRIRELGERRAPCPALTYVAVGGGCLSPALRQRVAEQITPNVFSVYGSTESGWMAMQYPDDPQLEPESVGRVVPWAEMQVVDAGDNPLPAGEQGHLRFRGHGFATSYCENPEATARFFRNGWFYPGDIGRVSPRGFLFIDTREDDMLNVGGLKVMPGESEGVLAAHPAVAEAAVFRTASASGEEFLVAAVVKREEVDDKALLEYCREKLGPRSPHRVVSVRELPRDAMGKVLRGALVKKIKSRGAK